ncbi:MULTISPECIES: hypothetical protein [Parachlamydia]|jgi:hypothetical protein|uniref:Uncharacterized protein n=2 Tax=Parachlamydia acanthamoebae TaxID=83552 RepID=F8KVQ8_PARAV|nr:hypothetical protein [Parachlamydia acanthamoebae]EFB42187.1 hypothetical protein pah_c014o120 [Parachlamydia acanthamoebae str. Hall's coccus]KIA76398.1 hypothetical protein DB43_AK00580 [Parachlamydia acanthamoebae]CCB85194.1 putative uncharacterized protein [Parachlamydia acanthamoebae UV-7]
MVANLTQQEYLTYFDAVQEVAKISNHGISNVYIDEGKVFTPILTYSWAHARLVDISRLVKSVFSKKKRQKRQQDTDQKIERLAQHIQTINKTTKRILQTVKKSDDVSSVVSPNYYSVRAATLFNDHLGMFQKWNKSSEEPKKWSWNYLKSSLRKFNGFRIHSNENLKISNQTDPQLIKIACPKLYGNTSIHFVHVCLNILRREKTIDSYRLQKMGGFTENAASQVAEILKKEKSNLNGSEKKAFEHVNMTASDPAVLETYWETMRAMTRPGAHQQLELGDEGKILHFKTLVGESLEVFFKQTKSTELLFQLFAVAKHHFCHNETSKMQAIDSLIAKCLKPYCVKQNLEIEEEHLYEWLKKTIAFFPEKENWIKALFFNEVIYAMCQDDHTKKESLTQFSINYLINDLLPESRIHEKLAHEKLTKRPKAS